jgi:uncharacterized protein (TIGR02466 family)
MKRYMNPFSSEIYINDECKLSNHEEIREFITSMYNESPNKDDGNFYGTGLTTYFYDDFTSHLDTLPLFDELKQLILAESKEYVLNRANELISNGSSIRKEIVESRLFTNGLEIPKLWFNVNPYGGYQGRHHHATNLLGGTYYLQTPKDSGKIGFSNANQFAYYKNQSSLYDHLTLSEYGLSPKEGTLLLWPGWMDHEISANANKEENRMTISFGINWGSHAQDI